MKERTFGLIFLIFCILICVGAIFIVATHKATATVDPYEQDDKENYIFARIEALENRSPQIIERTIEVQVPVPAEKRTHTAECYTLKVKDSKVFQMECTEI